MRDFNVDYHTINYRSAKNSPEIENMLAVMMDVIDDSTDINTMGETFFIEGYEQKDNGCIFFISVISENGIENLSEIYGLTDVGSEIQNKEPADFQKRTFITKSKQVLRDIANILYSNYGDSISNSWLYKSADEYRLIFEYASENEQEIYMQLIEFGELPEDNALTLAMTYEYFTPIIECNAIGEILLDMLEKI